MAEKFKITRKDLKGPDEFITGFGQAVSWIRENQSRFAAWAGVFILVVAAVLGSRGYIIWKENKATQELWPHLNKAREILEAPTARTDDERLVQIEKFLSSYVILHPKMEASVYARYYLGSIAFTRRNYDVSLAQMQAAIDLGKDKGVMRFLLRQGLAQALEAKGDFAGATLAYREAAKFAPGDLKFQAKLGEARVTSMVGKGPEALSIYREILGDKPDQATKEFVEIKLSRLQ